MRESASSHTFPVNLRQNSSTGCLLPYSSDVDFIRLAEYLSTGPVHELDSEPEPEPVQTSSKKRTKSKGKAKMQSFGNIKVNKPVEKRHKQAKRLKVDEALDTEPQSTQLPVLKHVFEFDFVESHEESSEEQEQSLSSDRDIIFVLKQRYEERGEGAVEVGTVFPHAYGGSVLLCTSDPLDQRLKNPLPFTNFLKLPKLVDESVKDSDLDFHSRVFKDILAAAYNMQCNNRARIAAQMEVIFTSPFLEYIHDRKVPFKFRVEVCVSLLSPTVFEPIYPVKKAASETEECQRRVLLYTFGLEKLQPEDYPKSTNVSFFLSCLRSAQNLPSQKAIAAAQPTELLAKLLPFQKRGAAWLLGREGKMIDAEGHVIDKISDGETLPLFWTKIHHDKDTEWYFNPITGRLSDTIPPADDFLGGILADEPGLGKTLESIALVLLNPPVGRDPSISRWDPIGVIDVKAIKTTLIVTPNALAQQWIDELKTHAPTLKVLIYDGWTKVPVPITERELRDGITQRVAKKYQQVQLDADDILDNDEIGEIDLGNQNKVKRKSSKATLTWCEFVNQYDVCITTYTTLQQDLGVARPPIQRPRREVATYLPIERDRSPLVMVEWHRVIMDEVQMVGGGKTEEMVSLIPRLSSFAVSGTPARSTVNDLIHVLNFLRVSPIIDHSKVWSRLQKPGFAGYFKELFEKIAIRTVKSKVQDELTIPKQQRFVVPIELGRVERHVYQQNLEQALGALGLDERGVAASSGWQIDVTLLRTWMRKLRGICTHPQIGQLSRQNNKLGKAGAALKSIAEVLENMKDQSWRSLMDEKKSKVQTMVEKARLIQRDESNEQRYHEALTILLEARTYMENILAEIREAIVELNEKGEILKQEAASRRQAVGEQTNRAPVAFKGKGKEREESLSLTDDANDDGLPKNPAGDEHRHKKQALTARLREDNIVMHHIHFLLGDTYHALGEAHAQEEDEAYAAAQDIRKKLLKTTEEVATESIQLLKVSASKKAVMEKDMEIKPFGEGGIKSKHLLREADQISKVLNDQTSLLFEWRDRILKLLTENLSVNEGDDADGQEYTRTLDTQGEAEALLQAYSALLADRREVLIAERTALAAHDLRERKLRHTAAAIKAAAALDKTGALEDNEMQPEHEVMQKEFSQVRKDVKKGYKGRAIRSIIVDLSGVCGAITSDKDPERIIAKEWITELRSLVKKQLSYHEKLETDLAQFRKAFNDRVSYFRQLQELSDTVAEVEWEGSLEDAIQKVDTDAAQIDVSIDTERARQRYLNNLANQDDEEEEDKTCILCKCDFTRGFITQCAHVFCETCFKEWYNKRGGKTCPVCRVIIDADQLQRITLKDKNEPLPVVVEKHGGQKIPKSKRVIEYNTISKDAFTKIQQVETLGSYGSKIETLVRHLLFLQEVDPGCKSIIFSAWADSLNILENALTFNSIGWLRIDQKKGKKNASKVFKDDPKMLVLLLHGERENAGLNITCASRVFLLESVVQHSFEIQAIARIDRMGQTRPTEVYCYYAENTVERGILDLAAKRGLSLYTKDQAEGTLKVTSFEMDKNEGIDGPASCNNKKQQKGDFIGKADDMLEILFPWMFETEIQYLFPDDEDANGNLMDLDDVDDDDDEGDFIDQDEWPAGPSRT